MKVDSSGGVWTNPTIIITHTMEAVSSWCHSSGHSAFRLSRQKFASFLLYLLDINKAVSDTVFALEGNLADDRVLTNLQSLEVQAPRRVVSCTPWNLEVVL